MHFLFGGDKKEDNKITNEFNQQLRSSLKGQFCQFCNKAPSKKVAFVPQLKRGFTCSNCELTAVGNDFKNLGEKTLITNEKLSETITKALISYQGVQSQFPQPIKQIQNQVKTHIQSSQQSMEKIKTQYKLLKSTIDSKLSELIKESQQQNSSVLFEQLNKKSKQKKHSLQEISQLVCKKSLVNKKGLHFIDEQLVENINSQIDERLIKVKEEMKIKLKQVDELTEWINKIQF